MLRPIVLALLSLLIAPIAAPKTNPAITEADLRERLFKIADDSMGGRMTGSPGHIKTTEYIAAEMKRLGLQPGGDNGSYFQAVPFVMRYLSEASITVDGQSLDASDYLTVYPGAPPRPVDNAQVVFGGIAQDSNTWIAREQAAGKLVLLANRSPNPTIRGTFRTRFEDAAGVATIQSSSGLLQARNFLRSPGPTYTGGNPVVGTRGVTLVISSQAAARLMGMPVDSTTATGTLGKTVTAKIIFKETPVTANNVIAILPGSDARLKGQYVVISAHSDHIGTRASGLDHDSIRAVNKAARKKQLELGGRRLTAAERAEIKVNVDSLRKIRPARLDSISNGADDDGSGTVGLIEIAEAMAGAKTKPARSIMFVWHVAEELGLIGARYYTEHTTVPRDSIVTDLNIDMIGRGSYPTEEVAGGPDYIQLIGWRRLSNELGDIIDAINKTQKQPFKFDLQYDANGHPERYYCRSDHYMYARYGIPIAFFSTGSHEDYHQVTDEPQYIDYAKLRNVSQLVHDIAVKVGNLDHRPLVDGPKPDPTGTCVQ
jgi:hypothetical protein